jgi:alpha-tubulin suppressor-like RCC1 family protein
MACDIAGRLGTCTAVASGGPRGNRVTCLGAGTPCAGSCGGRSDGACTYPTSVCGETSSCSGTSVVGQGTCNAGSCGRPAPQVCAGDLVCVNASCKTSCATNEDCIATHFCASGTCRARVLSAAASDGTTCVVLSTGKVWCWGLNVDGQLGQGVTSSSPLTRPTSPVVGLPPSDPPIAITAANYHTCTLLRSGAIYCWGSNSTGQLGNGTFQAQLGSVKVIGLPLSAGSLAAGTAVAGGHTCAALADSSVWCWGDNFSGELGNGMTHTAVPYGIATAVKVAGVTASSLAAGNYFTCGLSSGGLVHCWGTNAKGQLGSGEIPTAPPYNNSTPVSASFAGTGAALSVGSNGSHACVLTGSGAVRCWGENVYGQLGNGTFASYPVLGSGSAVTVTGLPVPLVLASGGGHSCVLTSSGAVWCWGANTNGQLGTGAATMGSPNGIATPSQASAISAMSPAGLVLGGWHSCAVLKNGSLWCWGSNQFGQLGNGTQVDSVVPVQVLGW